MLVIEIKDSDFESKIIKSNIPVLVDFWAPWCGPCRILAPNLEEAAKELEGISIIYKINIDDSPLNSSKFGIKSIPTMMLFKNGKVISTKTGVISGSLISKWVKEEIAK